MGAAIPRQKCSEQNTPLGVRRFQSAGLRVAESAVGRLNVP